MEALALIRLLATTLVLTEALELGLAVLLFGLRTRRELAVVALAQLVTNPAVELFALALGWSTHLPLASPAWAAVLAAELCALVVEALLYRSADVGRHPWLLSATLNLCSFAAGLVPAVAALLAGVA